MVEGQMNDSVRIGCSFAQTVEVFDVAMKYLGPSRSQLLGACFRTRQPQHMMPYLKKVRNKRRTDESGCPGHEDTHNVTKIRIIMSPFNSHEYAADLQR